MDSGYGHQTPDTISIFRTIIPTLPQPHHITTYVEICVVLTILGSYEYVFLFLENIKIPVLQRYENIK